MVYISRDGNLHNRPPWSLERIWGMILGFFAVVWMFLRSLVDPLLNIQANSGGSRDWRGGGGSGSRRGPPPGGPPRRPIGRVTTLADCNIPGGG